MKRILLSLILLFMMISSISLAQERKITGKVTFADDGSPVPGANVTLKNSAIGVITDVNGNYSINVPEAGGILVFSYIGLATVEQEIGSRSSIDVKMATDVTELSEIVVTAVGIEREKKALGYAVADLGSEKVQQRAEPDAVQALQGKVPGVNIIGSDGAVGSGNNITIRGNSSMLGNNQPLFVVDGVPFDNTTYASGSFTNMSTSSNRSFDLDPNNIESITVLKGAAAAALYGSRAANGVIVVTTKASRKTSKKGFEVTFNSGYNVEKVANLPDYQGQYTQGNNFKYVPSNYGTWGAPFDVNSPAWDNPLNGDYILSIDRNGNAWVPHPYGGRLPSLADDSVILKPYFPAEQFYESGNLIENAISLSTGTEKANFVAGFSHMYNKGIVPNNYVTRISANIGGNAQFDNGIFLGGSFNYVTSDMTSPPTSGLYTANSSVNQRTLFTPPNIDLAGWPYIDSEGNGVFYRGDNDNPYFLAYHSPNTSIVDRYYGNMSIGYEITDFLTVSYKAGFNGFNDRRIGVLPISSVDAPLGEIKSDDIRRLEFDGTLMFNLDLELNDNIDLTAILGHNINDRKLVRQSFVGSTIIVRDINDLDNTAKVIPNGGSKSHQRYQGIFADLTFGYKDWAFLNLTGRNDVSSTLPKSNRSYMYGGVSGSVILTDALGLKSNILDFGKLRMGYARVGNDTDPYYLETYFLTNSGIGNNIANLDFPFGDENTQTLSNRIGNPDLKPELTTEFETGFEVQLFQNKINLDFTYYSRVTTDQIVPISVAPSSGFSSKISNIGKVTNEGVEIGLGLTPLRMRNGFTWDILGVFTHNKNMIKEIGGGLDEVFVNGYSNTIRVVHVAGKEYGLIKGSVAARHTDGSLLVDPTTGKLIEAPDQEIIGNPNPCFTLGLTNTFKFKGFTLDVLFDYKHGGEMWSGTYNQLFGRGLTTETIPDHPNGREITLVIPGVVGDPETFKAVLDEEGNPIPNGTQLTVNDWYFINTFGSAGPNEFSVFDMTTIRLREISLSYEIPSEILEKTPFGSARLSLIGRNLWYRAVNFPKSLNFDPETNSLGAGNIEALEGNLSGNAQGVDFGMIPKPKRSGVNLMLTFSNHKFE